MSGQCASRYATAWLKSACSRGGSRGGSRVGSCAPARPRPFPWPAHGPTHVRQHTAQPILQRLELDAADCRRQGRRAQAPAQVLLQAQHHRAELLVRHDWPGRASCQQGACYGASAGCGRPPCDQSLRAPQAQHAKPLRWQCSEQGCMAWLGASKQAAAHLFCFSSCVYTANCASPAYCKHLQAELCTLPQAVRGDACSRAMAGGWLEWEWLGPALAGRSHTLATPWPHQPARGTAAGWVELQGEQASAACQVMPRGRRVARPRKRTGARAPTAPPAS